MIQSHLVVEGRGGAVGADAGVSTPVGAHGLQRSGPGPDGLVDDGQGAVEGHDAIVAGVVQAGEGGRRGRRGGGPGKQSDDVNRLCKMRSFDALLPSESRRRPSAGEGPLHGRRPEGALREGQARPVGRDHVLVVRHDDGVRRRRSEALGIWNIDIVTVFDMRPSMTSSPEGLRSTSFVAATASARRLCRLTQSATAAAKGCAPPPPPGTHPGAPARADDESQRVLARLSTR